MFEGNWHFAEVISIIPNKDTSLCPVFNRIMLRLTRPSGWCGGVAVTPAWTVVIITLLTGNGKQN